MEAICFGFRFLPPSPSPLSLSFSFSFSTLLRGADLEGLSTLGSGDRGACGICPLLFSPLVFYVILGAAGFQTPFATESSLGLPPVSVHRVLSCLILVPLLVLLSLAQLCLFYLLQFVSSLILRYKPKNDLCPCRRTKLLSGSNAGNRDFPVGSQERMKTCGCGISCVCVCVCVCLCVRGRQKERESVIVCGRVLRTDCISECVYGMCVYASFNSSLTRTVCACVFDMMSPCCDPEQGKDAKWYDKHQRRRRRQPVHCFGAWPPLWGRLKSSKWLRCVHYPGVSSDGFICREQRKTEHILLRRLISRALCGATKHFH